MNRKVLATRSIRYIGGEFFDLRMNSIFIPLSQQEEQYFINMVKQEEARLNRALNYEELMRIAANISLT